MKDVHNVLSVLTNYVCKEIFTLRAASARTAGSIVGFVLGCAAAARCACAARLFAGGRYPRALCSADISLEASAVAKEQVMRSRGKGTTVSHTFTGDQQGSLWARLDQCHSNHRGAQSRDARR